MTLRVPRKPIHKTFPVALSEITDNLAQVEGDLVRTPKGKWVTEAPTRCPNGHPLGPNQVLVGHVACLGHGGGGHTSWHCRTCDTVVYGPPLNKHCTALEGPASCGSPPAVAAWEPNRSYRRLTYCSPRPAILS